MNSQYFRELHLFALLEAYNQSSLPLDLTINQYFRKYPSLGSKDRPFIAETVYRLVRWQKLLDHLCEQTPSWQTRYQTLSAVNLEELQNQKDIPVDVRVSFPSVLFDLLVSQYGTEKAEELCLISNTPAPTTVRVNKLKAQRDDLLSQWGKDYEVSSTKYSKDGITFHKKMNFFQLPEFLKGFFEVQDEGSQLLAQLVKAQPGQHVLDYCAGSGGKTLAFAPVLEGKGQIYLHDIRPHALLEARKRLKRAGIQNSQILLPDAPHLNKLKKKMDWVLVDAPCSGTGTLRRNPDMKWKFTPEMVTRLTGLQRVIFEKALSFLHPEGRIIYATCSILQEENQTQLAHFMQTYSLSIEGEVFQSFPTLDGMDGFFGVVLKRR